MRPRKYHITLTQEEYNELLHLVKKGTTQSYKITHAQVLLKLDESFNEKPWNVEDISDAYHISTHAVCDIAARFVDGGLAHALERKKQMNRHHKITGDIQVQIIADRLVVLGVVDSLSATAVGTVLKKTNLSPGFMKNGVSPNPGQNS